MITFTPNESDAYLLNVEPSNWVFLRTCNNEFDDTGITFGNQNGRLLEIEDKMEHPHNRAVTKLWCDESLHYYLSFIKGHIVRNSSKSV